MPALINEEKLSKVIDGGLDKLMEVISEDKPIREHLVQARLASSIISTGTRYLAAQNSRISLQFRIASMVLSNNKERKAYLAAASPELKLLL